MAFFAALGGLAFNATLQSAIIGLITALLRKGGRKAIGQVAKTGFDKILNRAGAGISNLSVKRLQQAGRTGVQLGAGIAGFDFLTERLFDAAGGGEEQFSGLSNLAGLRPTQVAGAGGGFEEQDLTEILELLLQQQTAQGEESSLDLGF